MAATESVVDITAAAAAAAAAAATAPANEAAARAAASLDAAHDEILWARGARDKVVEAEGKLSEAREANDAQTRRVLQLQRAVGNTRRTLAACLVRSCLSAVGRGHCAYVLRRWALTISMKLRTSVLLDLKTARDGGKSARETAKLSEKLAEEVKEAAAKDIGEMKKRLMSVEKQKSHLREQLHNAAADLQHERMAHEKTKDEYDKRVLTLERARSGHEQKAKQLEIVQGERSELEHQLKSMRQRMKDSALQLHPPGSVLPPPLGTPPRGGGGCGGAGDDDMSTTSQSAFYKEPPGSPPLLPRTPPSAVRAGPSNPSSMRPTPTKADGDSDVAAGAWNTAGGVSKANAALEQKWRDEVREKEQALALRTRAVKDLKAAREELNKIKAELNESKRSFMMCRLLTHARSKIGRSAQLIRLLAALRDWRAACERLGGEGAPAEATAWVIGGFGASAPTASAPQAARPVWTTPATRRNAAARRGSGVAQVEGEPVIRPGGPQGWALALRTSRLGELRVRLLNRVLVWSVRQRYRCLMRWRLMALLAPGASNARSGFFIAGGDGSSEKKLHELLKDVEAMKQQVATSSRPSVGGGSATTTGRPSTAKTPSTTAPKAPPKAPPPSAAAAKSSIAKSVETREAIRRDRLKRATSPAPGGASQHADVVWAEPPSFARAPTIDRL